MIRDIRRDLMNDIDGRHPKVGWHPDSTTGISAGLSLLIEEDRLWSNLDESQDEQEEIEGHLDGSDLQQTDENSSMNDETLEEGKYLVQSENSKTSSPIDNRNSYQSVSCSDDSDGGVPLI